jgi:predicted double-glycine peptidase
MSALWKFLISSLVLCHALGHASDKAARVSVVSPSIHKQVAVQSWKSLRDQQVVKQDLDYSCGAASIATVLNEFYGQNRTEQEILEAMNKEDGMSSFADMQKVVAEYGFKAQGFAASWEQLVKLKVPVIIYLQHRKDDHFSVLRGIDGDSVWLADPSLGNRTYSKYQFLKMWDTRADDDAVDLKGKLLVILPAEGGVSAEALFFTKQVRRQTANAVQVLAASR